MFTFVWGKCSPILTTPPQTNWLEPHNWAISFLGVYLVSIGLETNTSSLGSISMISPNLNQVSLNVLQAFSHAVREWWRGVQSPRNAYSTLVPIPSSEGDWIPTCYSNLKVSERSNQTCLLPYVPNWWLKYKWGTSWHNNLSSGLGQDANIEVENSKFWNKHFGTCRCQNVQCSNKNCWLKCFLRSKRFTWQWKIPFFKEKIHFQKVCFFIVIKVFGFFSFTMAKKSAQLRVFPLQETLAPFSMTLWGFNATHKTSSTYGCFQN